MIDHEKDEKNKEKDSQPKKENSKKLSEKIKSQYTSSPKTLRKVISSENFIKFQWPWIL
jgi:hypothetical protein